jgi:HAD superfamily hydrolase (TIGR01549 family)
VSRYAGAPVSWFSLVAHGGAMGAAAMRYPALLFDCFRTILLFTPHAPTGQVKEPTWRAAMRELRGRAATLLGDIEFDFFLDALYDVSVAIARGRPPEHREVPIEERYRRALARLGLEGPEIAAVAVQLAHLQLEAQTANTEMPPEHGTLLRELARTRRLALVSNFDHGPTAHAILAHHGIADLFSAVVVSIEIGRRKPHPEIFQEALRRLGVGAGDALMVGDSLGDDVAGGQSAGLDTAWVTWGSTAPVEAPRPTYAMRTLVELPGVLAG